MLFTTPMDYIEAALGFHRGIANFHAGDVLEHAKMLRELPPITKRIYGE